MISDVEGFDIKINAGIGLGFWAKTDLVKQHF